jgi:hypothetical protein
MAVFVAQPFSFAGWTLAHRSICAPAPAMNSWLYLIISRISGNIFVVIIGQIAATIVMMICVRLLVSLGKLSVLIQSLFVVYVAAPMSSVIIYYDWLLPEETGVVSISRHCNTIFDIRIEMPPFRVAI